MKKVLVAAAFAILVCSFAACGDDPSGPGVVDSLFYQNTDSAWKVVRNLEYAYNHRDLDLYLTCFPDDFEYWYIDYMLPEPDSAFWGLEFETLCHESLFTTSEIDSITLTFLGDEDIPVSPDSTVRELTRTFDLKVYFGECGFHSFGTVVFICSRDSTGEYSIPIWYDQSDITFGRAPTDWPYIKSVLL